MFIFLASTYACGATQALNDRYCGQIFSVSDGAKETSDTTVVCCKYIL